MVQATRYGVALIALAAFVYSAIYHIKYWAEFNRLRSRGGIPAHLQQNYMRLGWMIGSAGLVPTGERHRKRCLVGAAVFGACLIAFMALNGQG